MLLGNTIRRMKWIGSETVKDFRHKDIGVFAYQNNIPFQKERSPVF